jgi:hypothetical protein
MTYPGLLMRDGSSKIHRFIDFWHPFSWRLWRAYNIKKMKTDELGINAPISWTRKIQNISKNQNLYPHQSRITYHSLQWDTLYNVGAKNLELGKQYKDRAKICLPASDMSIWRIFEFFWRICWPIIF